MKKKSDQNFLILGAVGLAAFLLTRKRAKAATPSNGADETPKDDEAPTEPELPPGSAKRDAPPLDVETATAEALAQVRSLARDANEIAIAAMGLDPEFAFPPPAAKEAEAQAVREALGVPGSQTIAQWIADQAYFAVTKTAGKIPNASDRGSGWKKYIDLWNATYEAGRTELLIGLKSA
jgi:hypothetical protein